jgi:hypothetical protein
MRDETVRIRCKTKQGVVNVLVFFQASDQSQQGHGFFLFDDLQLGRAPPKHKRSHRDGDLDELR